MSTERYVVAGVAHVRAGWFTEVARWSTVGSLPVEFVKCLSVAELRARCDAGRRFSAALLDGDLPAVDRDLLATLHRHGAACIVVADPAGPRSWPAVGADAVLAPDFDRSGLLDALAACSTPVSSGAEPHGPPVGDLAHVGWRAPLVAVLGRSGAGASTVAAALAQGLAEDPRRTDEVVLADLALRAHQALLHDAPDVVPGIQELVDAHRSGALPRDQVRNLLFRHPGRGYRVALGLRRHRDWVAVGPRALDAALDGLRRSARLVVADLDGDLEGEAETGSLDIEDRNHAARHAVAEADVVLVVATPTLTGLHGLAVQLGELHALGVPGDRIVAVLNRAPARPRAKAGLARTVADLVSTSAASHVGPVFVPERRSLEEVHQVVGRFPSAVTAPLRTVVEVLLRDLPPRALEQQPEEGVPLAPGSLGTWGGGSTG